MEYVGEILTHCEAEERGWTYDRSSLRLVMFLILFGCRVMCLGLRKSSIYVNDI